jgi:hypothetical protein
MCWYFWCYSVGTLKIPTNTGIMALSDLSVRNAKPGPRLQKLSDGRGLQLHITTNGSKLWRWAYRYDGHQKQMALGAYPDVSLAEAREATNAARKVLKSGTDPMEQRKADKINRRLAPNNTFQAIAMAWWENWKAARSPRHADYVIVV